MLRDRYNPVLAGLSVTEITEGVRGGAWHVNASFRKSVVICHLADR